MIRPMKKLSIYCLSTLLVLIICIQNANSQLSADVQSAEQTFAFIATTLRNVQVSGEIDQSLNLDETDESRFINILQEFYEQFRFGFSPDSPLCNYYRDPNNGIFDIEQRAELSMQFLPEPDVRVERFVRIDKEFRAVITVEFGSDFAQRVEQIKQSAVSFEYLPTREFNAAEAASFADSACR